MCRMCPTVKQVGMLTCLVRELGCGRMRYIASVQPCGWCYSAAEHVEAAATSVSAKQGGMPPCPCREWQCAQEDAINRVRTAMRVVLLGG